MQYTEKVMDHFMNPRNVGEISDADGIGQVGNPICGDVMSFYIKVKDDRITDVKFKTFGCGAAIAVSSMVSEMAKGMKLDEAMEITNKRIAQELGGLPAHKFHCSNLGADALHAAIENYREKSGKAPAAKERECVCPYCHSDLPALQEICKICRVKLARCPDCGALMSKDSDICPACHKKK